MFDKKLFFRKSADFLVEKRWFDSPGERLEFAGKGSGEAEYSLRFRFRLNS